MDNEDIIVNSFTEEAAKNFHRTLIKMSREDPNMPIVIYIDSYGGQVDALASMIESMDSVPNKKITVVKGKAMSCGAILFSAGDYRFVGRHSRVMIHEVGGGANGNVHDVKESAEEIDRINRQWLGFLAKRCEMEGYDELRAIMKNLDGRNLTLAPKEDGGHEAIDFKIADEIGLPLVQSLWMYKVLPLPEYDYDNEECGLTEKEEEPAVPAKKTKKASNKKKSGKKK